MKLGGVHDTVHVIWESLRLAQRHKQLPAGVSDSTNAIGPQRGMARIDTKPTCHNIYSP